MEGGVCTPIPVRVSDVYGETVFKTIFAFEYASELECRAGLRVLVSIWVKKGDENLICPDSCPRPPLLLAYLWPGARRHANTYIRSSSRPIKLYYSSAYKPNALGQIGLSYAMELEIRLGNLSSATYREYQTATWMQEIVHMSSACDTAVSPEFIVAVRVSPPITFTGKSKKLRLGLMFRVKFKRRFLSSCEDRPRSWLGQSSPLMRLSINSFISGVYK